MKLLTAVLCFSVGTVFASINSDSSKNYREIIAGEYIVKAHEKNLSFPVKRVLGKNLVLVQTSDKSLLDGLEYFPNYKYVGEYRDFEDSDSETGPNDEKFEDQFHHKMIKTKKAWATTKGSSDIIVAVTDNEFFLGHKDLKTAWFKNSNEIPDDGIDNDNNGYIDDVIGWDFIGQDNNVDSDRTTTHGTHVAGIIAATANNEIGGAGIAPNVKVMPLRWYGPEGEWTSAVIAETYRYAVDNGAKIINTSYNVDRMVDDEAYLDAIAYIRENDVLIVNSAGNAGEKDPPRQKIEELILVCSVKSGGEFFQDQRSSFSNYGSGIDICAPGDPVLAPVRPHPRRRSTTQGKYGQLQGTSMAAPAAAAVAALIWSAHPNFSDEEVRQRLLDSADDITRRQWPWSRSGLGAGRINAANAVK
ncbi:MAG: hypothetical protein CME65_04335 [Halobacteriovoraceae bacterium]|nr:hypothetical protein [Halobacteriovoraceae bacterium]|tara:strand:- start:969 stop:2216 length:1248 start_codon:yes stop_codon:yes gene_type:complete